MSLFRRKAILDTRLIRSLEKVGLLHHTSAVDGAHRGAFRSDGPSAEPGDQLSQAFGLPSFLELRFRIEVRVFNFLLCCTWFLWPLATALRLRVLLMGLSVVVGR